MGPEVIERGVVEAEFKNAALQKVEAPDGHDRYIQNLGHGMLKLFDEDPEVMDELVSIYEDRHKHKPMRNMAGYILNLVRVDINRNHLKRSQTTERIFKRTWVDGESVIYPECLNSIAVCKEEIRRSLHLDDPLHHNIELYRREVQSNPYQRARILKFMGIINKDRVGSRPTTLDFGCSLNLVLKWLDQNNQRKRFPLDPVTVYGSTYPRNHHVVERTHNHRTILMNEILTSRYYPGPGHGVDIWPVKNAADQLWVASCQYPRELEDNKRLAVFNALKEERPNVTFSRASCEDIESLKESIPGGKRNFVFLSFILHQNTDENISKIIYNAEQYASDYIVVLDAARPDDSSPHGLRIEEPYSEKNPYNIRVLIKDMKDPDKGFQEIMRVRDGRCRHIIINRRNPMMREVFKI